MKVNRIKLFSAMLERDINVTCLAELSGISRVTISNIRSGKSCSESTANKLAKALDISVTELKENMATKKE